MKLTKSFVNNCRNIGVLRDFLCQAIDQVDAMEEERRWRNCSEELPEKDKYVLAFCPNLKSIEIARILDDEWRDFSWNYLEVTHWMPLPKTPED
jgi:hypothetical protein